MISINLTLIFQMAIFLAALFVLNRMLFQPLLEVFDARERRVHDALAEARRLETETATQVAGYESRLQAARGEGLKEQESLRRASVAESETLLKKTREETGTMIGDLRERIAREYAEASRTLRADAAALSREVAARILGRPA